MKRKNDVRAIADGQLLANIDACLLQLLHLFDQRRRVDNHAIADHGLDAGSQNAARDQLQNKLLRANKHGMPRVMAALIASHD